MFKKIVGMTAGLVLSATAMAAEYHGYVRGVYLNEDGLLRVSMGSDTSTASACAGVFDTTQFGFNVDNSNSHIVASWLPLLESARQAKMAQEGATTLPHPASDPALIKIGYTVNNNVCEINYVYYLHWYNL